MQATQEFFTVPELAEHLNVGTRFIYRIVDERRINHHKVGKHLRFHVEDVEGFIKACHVLAVRDAVTR